MQAVILAGGKGKRLRPYTTVLPKPMMPIGEKPILGVIIEKLARSGITDIVLTVGYLAGIIQAYFGDGKRFGVNIEYFVETEPLGTAGCLSLIENLQDEFIVMNGDILSSIDFNDLIEYHRKMGNPVTICSYKKEIQLTLGVLDLEGATVRDYIEKPKYSFNVSTGIYAMNREAVGHIPKNQYFDFPTLIKRLIAVKEPISVYQFEGEWYDIGREEDYRAVLETFDDGAPDQE
jgi:NDP-sugar pyrophosphorylase family protein